jgi:hypothetical protein
MDRVLRVVDQQAVVAGVKDLLKLFSRHRRCELPAFGTHGVVTEATGEFALGAQRIDM